MIECFFTAARFRIDCSPIAHSSQSSLAFQIRAAEMMALNIILVCSQENACGPNFLGSCSCRRHGYGPRRHAYSETKAYSHALLCAEFSLIHDFYNRNIPLSRFLITRPASFLTTFFPWRFSGAIGYRCLRLYLPEQWTENLRMFSLCNTRLVPGNGQQAFLAI